MKYKKTELSRFIKHQVARQGYTTVTGFARDMGLDPIRLGKSLQGEIRLDLHQFMALVETLGISPSALYARVYKHEKEAGLL